MVKNFYLSICGRLIAAILLLMTSHSYADIAREGQPAPNFKLTRLDGSHFQLSDYRGKKTVYLTFWNTWCSYCYKKIPQIKALHSQHHSDIEVLAINTGRDDSVSAMQAFQQKQQVNYPLAFDRKTTVTELYGVRGTPTTFIIDINGVIRHRDHIPTDIGLLLASWNTPTPTTVGLNSHE